MNKQQIRNGSVFPIEKERKVEMVSDTVQKETVVPDDKGLVLEELFIAAALLGLMISGETIGVGRRAVDAANEVIDAMHADAYGGK